MAYRRRSWGNVAVKLFFDASAFAKRYLEEPGSDTVETLCMEATDLGLCVICVPEIISAMNRRLRERRLTKSDHASLKRHLLEDVRDAARVRQAHLFVSADERQIAAARKAGLKVRAV